MASKKSRGSNGRAKPAIPKAGVTKNRARRYDCGGKIKTKSK